MLKFKEVKLENIVYYKKARLDLDYKGTTVILGKNLNSVSKNRRNGAGKSLLVSTIPHIRYGEPTGYNKAKHTLLSNKDSVIRWRFEQKGVEWDIRKYRKGKSIKWGIFKDGRDEEPRTATIAESLLREIITLNEEEFYTTVYLDSRRANVLTGGTASQRHKYFTDLFRLYDFDSLRVYFTDKLKELDRFTAEKDSYDTVLEDLDWIKSFDADSVKSSIKKHKSKIRLLKNKINKKGKELYARRIYDKHRTKILDSKKYDESIYVTYKKLLEEWVAYKEYLEVKNEYNTQYDKYRVNIDKVRELLGVTKISKRKVDDFILDGARKDERYEIDMKKYKSNLRKKKDIRVKQKRYNELKHVLDIEIDLPKLIADVKILSKKLKDMSSQSGKRVCDYCGASISEETLSKHIRSIKKKLSRAKMSLKKGRSVHEQQVTCRELIGRLDKKVLDMKPVKPVKPSRAYMELMGISLSKPKKPREISKPKESYRAVLTICKEQKRYKNAYNIVKRIANSINEGSSLKDAEILNKELCILNDERDSLIKSVAKKEERLKEYLRQKKTFDSYISKIKKIDKRLKDRFIFEALVKAYGAKGIKLMIMNNIVKTIVKNMNQFSHLLFLEPFSFDASIEENVFDIIVTRRDGTASDIRNMSGAESRLFSLLWLISVLPLIPDSRRMNIVILDEFEAGMDEVTRSLILDKFLFNLNTIVPHIIFISPFFIQEAPGRRVLTAVKRGGTAKLI